MAWQEKRKVIILPTSLHLKNSVPILAFPFVTLQQKKKKKREPGSQCKELTHNPRKHSHNIGALSFLENSLGYEPIRDYGFEFHKSDGCFVSEKRWP